MGKETIIRNFSRYAYLYDKYADVQRRAALELAKEIKENSFDKILEVGCGTGNYTFILRKKFRDAKIKAIDISANMLEVAQEKLKYRDIEFVVEDGESLNLDEKFDLFTSNACFQWFQDLEEALGKYKDSLKKNGVVLFSIFGPSTFRELDVSLKYLLKGASIDAANFITKERITGILNKNFERVKIRETEYREYFCHLKDLLDKIKYTGIRGRGVSSKVFLGRKFLKELEDVYFDKFSATNLGGSANHFGGRQIKATYQVFFCQGVNA